MTKNDDMREVKETVIRMDERIKTIFSSVSEIKDDMKDIKSGVTNVKNDVSSNKLSVATCNTKVKDHIDSHKRDLTIAGIVIAAFTFLLNKVWGG